MYYLNAFNEMLRKRQQQNNMMGGGQDQGVGTTAPSGPMGLGPAQDRNAFRDTLNSMSPLGRTAMGMMPVIGPAFNVGRLVDSGISAYQSSQLAPSRDARERSQDQFRASEISDMNAPSYSDDSMDRMGFNAPVSSPVAQSSFVGEDLSPMAPVAFSSPVSQSSVTADNSYGGFGDATGGSDTMGFAGEYAHGGMVHAEHLKGRAPAPDDGYGALQGGEYVITKAAVEKYGKRLLDAINNGTFR